MNAQGLLRKLVELAGGPSEQGYILALENDTLGEVPPELTTEKASYAIHRVKTELALRRLLWKTNGAPFIGLVHEDLARRLPADVIRRARGGRVLALELSDVLELVLGVRVVLPDDQEVQDLVLLHLERLNEELRKRTLPTVVDRDLLDELLLEVAVHQRVRDASPSELLAEWVRSPIEWSVPVQSLLERNLPILQGTEGRILAWAVAHGRLEELIIRGAILAVDVDELPPAAWGSRIAPLKHDPGIGLSPDALRAMLVSMAEGALDVLGEAAASLLTRAETEARRILPASALARSRILPLGLDNRCAELAESAARGNPIPSSEVMWLHRHRAARFKGAELAVLEALARLSRFLAEPHRAVSTVPDALVSYQHSGAFADLAATRLRRALAATAAFHTEARIVLDSWRTRRDEENRAFASRLAENYEKALFSPGLVPLHRVWHQVVLPALKSTEDAGVFMVVLDGCSYPVFLELLDALSHQPDVPIGLVSENGLDDARGICALAPLPSITSHARGALFLGEIPSDPLVAETVWREQTEGTTDPARFNRNPTLGSRTRRLFLKGQLADGGLALREALLDSSLELVAVVFNAIDDQIGSSNTGAVLQVKPEHIMGFLPALRTALSGGRRVLLTADHGHTPFLGTEHRVGKGSTPRYRPLLHDEEPPDGFVEIDLKGLGGAPGRVAFAWRLGAYQGLPQVGFHGGCGLEELVVPMAWLGRNGVPADEPTWWYGEALTSATERGISSGNKGTVREKQAAKKRVPPPASRASRSAARPVQPAQPSQFDLFNASTNTTVLAQRIGQLRLPDTAVALLSEQHRAALVLLSDVKTASATELGGAIGKAPGRVSGFMTQLRRRLHTVGRECFREERLSSGEVQFIWQAMTEKEG